MKTMKTLGAAVATLAGMLALAAPGYAQAPDISGRWNVIIVSPQGSMPASPMELRKDGEKYVGIFYTQQGNADVEATMKDTAVTFFLPPFQTEGGPIQIAMVGTVDGDTMKGTINAGDVLQLDWTAKRAQAPPPSTSPAAPVDLTGTWGLEVVTSAGTGTPTIVLKQEAEKLSGQYSGQLGEAPITGTIMGNEFTFSFSVTVEGNTGTIIYSGTAENDTMKGTVNLAEMGDGTFTGKRK